MSIIHFTRLSDRLGIIHKQLTENNQNTSKDDVHQETQL